MPISQMSRTHAAIVAIALATCSWVPTAGAAVVFTNQCENALTGADRNLFEDAVDLIDEYRTAVEAHINDSRAAGNPNRYSFIDGALMDDWRDTVDNLVDGNVEIACEYNAMLLNTCAANPGRMGLESDIQPGRIHVCIDNLRAFADNPSGSTTNPVPGSRVALLAGTMSHELMHIVDGLFVGHTNGTSARRPATPAETIGVAMEHVILTPDLDATIRSLEIDCCQNGEAILAFDVLLKNMNAEANIGLRPASLRVQNGQSTLQAEVDGQVQQQTVGALNGSASTTLQFEFRVPALEVAGDGIYDIVASADIANMFFESSERNNVDEATVSTAVDLALDVEVAAAPECHSLEYREDITPAGYYSWIEIPFRAEVTNLDQQNTAPRVDIVMTYDDMWTGTSLSSQQIVWADSLSPQDRDQITFHLEVPTNPACSGPTGGTQVWFDADGNAATLNDTDRSNNRVELLINGDYWRPDYAVREVAPLGAGNGSRTISYAVRNIGPAVNFNGGPVALPSTEIVDPSETTMYFSAFLHGLGPGEQQVFETTLPVADCGDVSYLLIADSQDVVDEYDELNNVSEVALAPLTSGGICTPHDQAPGDQDPSLDWIEQNGVSVLYDKFDSLNTEEWGTDRATGMDIGSGLPILDQLGP